MRFTASVVREGTWFVAQCLEIDVVSQGVSLDEALANLKEALELYLEDQPAPEPLPSPIIAHVDVSAS